MDRLNWKLTGSSPCLCHHAFCLVFGVRLSRWHPGARQPVADSIRSILGPALGGALAQPCQSYPNWFPQGTLFCRFPFLLPNLVCAVILAGGVVVAILFLEETHGVKKNQRDRGLECGKWIAGWFRRPADPLSYDKASEAVLDESRSLMEDEQPPGYRTTEGSPRDPSSRSHSPSAVHLERNLKRERSPGKPRRAPKVFTKPIVLLIVAYGILA